MKPDPISIQREYYKATAEAYDSMHLMDEEHNFALSLLTGVMDYLEIASILDIGSGTGRAILYLKARKPNLQIIGIEPVQALREQGHAKGIEPHQLIDGDATALQFADNSFDLVCEFAALHHIPQPDLAVSEMLRVAKKAIFISDSNRFGGGTPLQRTLKQLLGAVGLWGLANYIKTRGKGYILSEGDGLSYSYSVFDNYDLIRQHCRRVHLINTGDAGTSLYRSSAQVALLGIK